MTNTNNTKSFENLKKITDTVRSQNPNCIYATSNLITRKDKPGMQKKVQEFNDRLEKFCTKNKIDLIENNNMDNTCVTYKRLHLNKKGNSYLANNFIDYINYEDTH